MTAILWKKNGRLVKQGGVLIKCEECPCEPSASCSRCVDGRSANAYLLRIAGMASLEHEQCAALLNGDFVVNYVAEYSGDGWSKCVYQGVWSSCDPYIGELLLVMEIRWGIDAYESMSIEVHGFRQSDYPAGTGPYFLATDITDRDCLHWAELDIPLFSALGLLECGADEATCQLWALPMSGTGQSFMQDDFVQAGWVQ